MVKLCKAQFAAHLFRQVTYEKAQQLLAGLFVFSATKKELLHYFLVAGAVTTAAIASV